MNLVDLLESAVQALPSGDYSTGLNAIVRHVKAAVRHLERDKEHDPDTCTDAIYRMNQAYEGSLKEAYRVLAGKDPSGLSPFQIEEYLEINNIVRPRVLTQLTRYRQDYRNPSTHDYKLDFDEDEAILAIVSVCAFAKLLINQISSRVASEKAQKLAVPQERKSKNKPLKSSLKEISTICLAFTNESSEVNWFEYEEGIAESLKRAGWDATVHNDRNVYWDISIKKGKSFAGVDVRMGRHSNPEGKLQTGSGARGFVQDPGFVGAILIIRSLGRVGYQLYRGQAEGRPVYVICEPDPEQIDSLLDSLGELQKI